MLSGLSNCWLAAAKCPIAKTRGSAFEQALWNLASAAKLRLSLAGARVSGVRSHLIGGAANAALNHFTKALADEGAKSGVRVVGINPGPILTERLVKMRSALAPSSPDAAARKPSDA